MATNEVYKYSQWIPLPVVEGTVNGSPVLVGDGLVGVAQEVGGLTQTWSIGGTALEPQPNLTVSYVPASNHLEPGYASVALVGAWALDVEGATLENVGDAVFITQGTGGAPATLSLGSGDYRFGFLINMTTDGRAVVRIEGGAA
jgi:hypothetical protein